jgi:hypothetical protein
MRLILYKWSNLRIDQKSPEAAGVILPNCDHIF